MFCFPRMLLNQFPEDKLHESGWAILPLVSRIMVRPFQPPRSNLPLRKFPPKVVLMVVIHTSMLFFQVVTLNVAVNSYSNALLSLLMSNQFVEIKGTVFKKFEKENLFQMSCAGTFTPATTTTLPPTTQF
jgi:hypothetical protein